MHFCNQRKQFAASSTTLDKNPIKVATKTKFLGMVFDRTLSYKSHVDYLKTNCLKTLDILKVVGHTDWGADRKTLLCLYRAVVRPKLNYDSIAYGAASEPFYRNWTLSITRFAKCSWSFSHFSCKQPLCESTVS